MAPYALAFTAKASFRADSQTKMQSRLSKPGLVGLAFVLACALALLSVLVERTGPELVQYGNLCGTTFDAPCYRLVLKGGFPFAYLFDMPGVSVENQLSLGEDILHPTALMLNIVAYFSAVMLSILAPASRGAQRADA
jgi:hypothetical protein